MAAELKYEIVETLGVLSENSKGWTKELNLIKWNDNAPKYDLRDWSPEHDRMGKGVTLTMDEIATLKDILESLS
ncbi:MAG: YdbC family protein [Clostridia bacterium]|nr:YdbC family protein [Clostridia bacterium]